MGHKTIKKKLFAVTYKLLVSPIKTPAPKFSRFKGSVGKLKKIWHDSIPQTHFNIKYT